MPPKAITRAQFIERFSNRAELDPKVGAAVVKKIISSLSNSLVRQQRIEIRTFGSFGSRVRPPRLARNPKTGERVSVPASRTIGFKAGNELKEAVNSPSKPNLP